MLVSAILDEQFSYSGIVSNQIIVNFWRLPKELLILLIKGYQKTLSPDHGALKGLFPHGCCRHSPTCSEYAIEVIRRRGLVVGSLLTTWRVLRCNPFARPSDERLAEAVKKTLS